MPEQIPGQHKRAAAFVKSLTPAATRQEIADSVQSGLYLVMQPSGALSWAVRTKIGGKPAKITIGRYDESGADDDRIGSVISPTQALSVTQARGVAERVVADAKRGNDPRENKSSGNKFGIDYWFGEFVKTARTSGFKGRAVKTSTADEYERIIDISIKTQWKHISDIRTLDYRDVEKLIAKLQPGAQRNVFAVLSAFFRWKPVARVMGRNIIELAEAPAKPQSRERVLTHDEIKSVWKAADACDFPFGPIVKMLLLTGQRRDEIANLKWSELDADLTAITLEGTRTKNGRAHVVPLAPLAKTIIEGLPVIADADGKPSEFVFASRLAKTPFSGFSKGKIALDKHVGEPELPDWHLHDLRRTAATGMAKLGVKQEVTEAILNHKTGKVSGVAAIYNRYDYADEKRDALEKWAERVSVIIAGNVTMLPNAAERRA